MRKLKITFVSIFAAVGIATSAGMASAHTVQPGETLSSIAAANGTTYQHLAEINGISNPNLIFTGQHIKTSGGSSHPTPNVAKIRSKSEVQNSGCLNNIIFHESGNNPSAVNPSSGTYGLAQWLPGTGPGIGASYAVQYAAAHDYALSRYGSDCQAWAFWQNNSWW